MLNALSVKHKSLFFLFLSQINATCMDAYHPWYNGKACV